MTKKFLSIIIALTIIIGTFGMAYAIPSDVIGTDLEEVVGRLEGLGVFTGYPDGTFRASDKITRSEYAAVVTRAKGLKQLADSSQGETSFGDVGANFWASGYINVAEEENLIKGKGIINGVNTFGPLLNITYEEAVTIVVRALGYESAAQQNGGWSNGYLTVAQEIGLLEDVNGTLGISASRGLVAQLTYNALEIPNMIKVGSNYIKSGTQGTDELYLFNELHMINKAASDGNWSLVNLQTFSKAGITGVTAGNIASLKATLETLAGGSNKHWSPSDIQGVFDSLATGNKVILAEAINATQVQIKFNTKLDAADAITNAPYKVSISGVLFTSANLSEDGKTLTLTASAPMNLTNAALIVEPIQTADNAAITTERYTASYSYSDTKKADLVSVTSKTNSSTASKVNVKFSEPIQSLGTVKINGVVKSAVGFTAGDSEANFTGLSLDASQSHDIQITSLKDRASNISAIINKTFDIVVDTVLPTVSLSGSNDRDNVIVFEFDKPITTASANANLVSGIVKDEILMPQASGGILAINASGGLATRFEMAVTSPFSSLATRNLTVLLPAGIKDELGNELATTNKTVTLTKDITAPEIEDVGIVRDSNGNVVSLTISTDSTLAAKGPVSPILPSQLTVVDPDGIGVNTATWFGGLDQDAISAGDKKISLSFAPPIGKLSGVYIFTFKSGMATDEAVSPNSLKAKTVSVDFGAPTSTGSFAIVSVTSGGSNIYDVNFGGQVKGGLVSGSSTDLANYTLSGNPLPVGTTIILNPAKDTAQITLPAESIAVADPAAVLSVSNVQKLTGETNIPYTTTVVTDDNVKPVMNYAVLSDDNKLVVGFSETIVGLPTPSDFRVKVNGKTLLTTPAFVVGVGSDYNKFVLDFNPLIINDGTRTFIEMDGVLNYSAGDVDTLQLTIPPVYEMKNSTGITSVTIEVIAGATTDLAMNNLKVGTMITAK